MAGTYVIMIGFDLAEKACDGLLGFSVRRTDRDESEAYYLSAMKTFVEANPGLPAGAEYSTRDHPTQSFQWADFSAKPRHRSTYVVSAKKGEPGSAVIEIKRPDCGLLLARSPIVTTLCLREN